MKKIYRRNLSVLLAGLFCFISVMHSELPVKADGEPEPVTVSGVEYIWDGNIYLGFVLPNLTETSITIPSDYHLIVGDEAEGNTLAGSTVSIESGGSLELYAPFEGSLSPSDGACLRFGSSDNVPEGLALYEADAETEFGDTDNMWSHTFCYVEEIGRWADLPGEPCVDIDLGGYNPDTDEITIQYKYTGEENYRTPEFNSEEDPDFPGNFRFSFEPADISDSWDNLVHIKVTFATTGSAIMVAADNDNGDLSSCISENGTVFTYSMVYDDCNRVGISLGFPDSGDPAIVGEALEHLYAYCPTGGKTVKQLFAEEIICRLMDPSLFDNFGLPEINGNAAIRAANVTEMENRIEPIGSSATVTAKDTAGNNVDITVQNYQVNWGYSYVDGSEVSCTIPVYTLSDVNQVLICTDFNARTGSGSNFYICNIANDGINLSDGDGVSDGGVLFLVNSITPATVKAGAMGRIETVINDDGLCTIEVNGGAPASYLRVTDPVQNGERIRFLKTSEKYVSIGGEGETKTYGLIGDNGSNIDGVWATGNNANAIARVYVGDTTVHLYPLSGTNTGLSGTGITSVELVDSNQAEGVILVTTDLTDITLTFTSNFYDEIPLKITFEGGTIKYLTIIRVGLVIQYQYLEGNPNEATSGGDHGEIKMDYQGASIGFDYDYFAGEQIAVWATYYHPSSDPTGGAASYSLYLTFDDGSHDVLTSVNTEHNFNGTLGATGSAVASTTFLIGFKQAWSTFNNDVWLNQLNETEYGGFSATVLNAGYNDNTTYSGTQMGSGKGVYWDGHISFY